MPTRIIPIIAYGIQSESWLTIRIWTNRYGVGCCVGEGVGVGLGVGAGRIMLKNAVSDFPMFPYVSLA